MPKAPIKSSSARPQPMRHKPHRLDVHIIQPVHKLANCLQSSGKRTYYLNAIEPTQVFATKLNIFVPYKTTFVPSFPDTIYLFRCGVLPDLESQPSIAKAS